MGDEINEIYAEKRKSKFGLQQQIEDLRKELALVRETGNNTVEAREQDSEDAARIAELESELGS